MQTDIQQMIDDYLKQHPELTRYIGDVVYVPKGGKIPAPATHVLTLASVKTQDSVRVAITGKVPYTILLDALLGVL